MSNVIIIGGGVAGISAAIKLAKYNEVTILERNSDCLKKLLLTGNGRCNYFNEDFNSSHYHSNNNELLKEIINDGSKNELLTFFNSLGLIPKIKNGYYYPYSNNALSVKNSLLLKAKSLGVKIINNTYVEDIEKENNNFIIKTNNSIYKSEKVVIATGSKSYPKTGSEGNLYNVLEKLGHNIIKPLPSLVQLIGSGDYFKEWKGVRADAIVSLYEDNKFIKEEDGEIQLTDYGISGICSMQLSGIIARGLDNKKCEKVTINFFPRYKDINELVNFLNEEFNKNRNKNISQLLENIINYKLGNLIIKLSGYKNNDKLDEIDVEKLAKNIINFSLEIIDTKGFDSAQTCSGGVNISEVNLNTMESKIVKNLYLVGEVLDIDGDCGGYNLSYCFLSGIRVGRSND